MGRDADDLFRDASWVQVMLGQGQTPCGYDPMANGLSDDQLDDFLGNVRTVIERAVEPLPQHEAFLAQ